MTAALAVDRSAGNSAPAHTWRAALAAADAAPRCGARCRTRGHAPCRGPAMANGRCRMHGGASTGVRTEAGRERRRRARTRHGGRSAYWVGQRKLAMKIRREGKRLRALVDLKLMDRAAAANGIESGLDWDDLPFRPMAHVEAQKTLLAARMLAPPVETPPPAPKVTLHPMRPAYDAGEGVPPGRGDAADGAGRAGIRPDPPPIPPPVPVPIAGIGRGRPGPAGGAG